MNSLLAIVFLVLLSSSYIGSTPLSECLGCPKDMDPSNVDYIHRTLIEDFYNKATIKFYGTIIKFTKASKQLVAGTLYKYEFDLVIGKCKDNVPKNNCHLEKERVRCKLIKKIDNEK